MSNYRAAKASLVEALGSSVDPILFEHKFKRRKGSLTFKRVLPESVQEIHFYYSSLPRWESGAEAHITPYFAWKIPSVAAEALRLVNGNKDLLAGAPV